MNAFRCEAVSRSQGFTVLQELPACTGWEKYKVPTLLVLPHGGTSPTLSTFPLKLTHLLVTANPTIFWVNLQPFPALVRPDDKFSAPSTFPPPPVASMMVLYSYRLRVQGRM